MVTYHTALYVSIEVIPKIPENTCTKKCVQIFFEAPIYTIPFNSIYLNAIRCNTWHACDTSFNIMSSYLLVRLNEGGLCRGKTKIFVDNISLSYQSCMQNEHTHMEALCQSHRVRYIHNILPLPLLQSVFI